MGSVWICSASSGALAAAVIAVIIIFLMCKVNRNFTISITLAICLSAGSCTVSDICGLRGSARLVARKNHNDGARNLSVAVRNTDTCHD